MIRIAFYRGRGNAIDSIVRVWTQSIYSHTEIVIDDIWYGASPRDGGVVRRRVSPKKENWDYIDIECSDVEKTAVIEFLEEQIGKRYDYLGIFTAQIIGVNADDKKKWFCSELAASALIDAGIVTLPYVPNYYSPARLCAALQHTRR